MKCSHCGTENVDNYKYCKRCGAFLKSAENKPPNIEDEQTIIIQTDDTNGDENVASANTKKRVDINNSDIDTIANLPGIGLIMAKRIAAERIVIGGYKSLDQFSKDLSLKPYIVKRIKSKVEFKPVKSNAKNPETSQPSYKRGRGRIVDF